MQSIFTGLFFHFCEINILCIDVATCTCDIVFNGKTLFHLCLLLTASRAGLLVG